MQFRSHSVDEVRVWHPAPYSRMQFPQTHFLSYPETLELQRCYFNV